MRIARNQGSAAARTGRKLANAAGDGTGALLAALLIGLSVGPATAVDPPFETPWIGYGIGESAFPGNVASFERDPYAVTSGDFDGDGDIDIAAANYDYASPGGTNGLSGFVFLRNHGDGTFADPVHYTVSTKGHFDIVAADFDEDGDLDLAMPHSGRIGSEVGNSVVVFLNDGAGTFANNGFFTVAQQPLTLAAGDFDADGHVDLVAGSHTFSSEHVAVLPGDGAGGFGPRHLVFVGPTPNQLATGDFDEDGYDDLAVTALGDLMIVLNDGTGSFEAPVALSGSDSREPIVGVIATCDLDDDGNVDLVHGSYQSEGTGGDYIGMDLTVRLGHGDGTFAAPVYYDAYAYGTTPEAVLPADVDGDGDLDVTLCDWSGRTGDGIHVLFNDGSGILGDPHVAPGGQGTQDVTLADLDGDGDLDAAAVDRMSLAVTVHQNPGDGRFPVVETRFPSGTSTTLHLVPGDIDGDGDLDLFASGEAFGTPGAALRNEGDGTFTTPEVYTHSGDYGRGVSNAKLVDLDGDGDLDLLYNDAHTDFFTGYDFWTGLNDGNGNFGPLTEWDNDTCGNGDVNAFDIDNDGDLDVINTEELACAGVESANKLFINLNNGDATFQPPYVVEISTGPHTVDGGDFDEDGNVDLVTTHWMPYGARNFLNIHLGNGDGTFQEEVVYFVGQGPRDLVITDLDGDGHQDLVTANSGADDIGRETLTTLFGNGDGTFSGRVDYYAPYSPDLLGVTGLTAADVDEDGDLDVMLTTVANSVTLYLNDGTGALTLPYRFGTYWGPWSPVHADFDGDDTPDLAMLVSSPPSGGPRELAIQRGIPAVTTNVDPFEPDPSPSRAAAMLRIYPNPATTRATFALEIAREQEVSIAVFDPSGRRVQTIHDGNLSPGQVHTFDVSEADLPNGIYLVRARGEDFVSTGRLSLVR